MMIREHLEVFFRASGFDIDGDSAVAASGYGSGSFIVDLLELEKELAEAAARRIWSELQELRRNKVLTQHEIDGVYERMRSIFVDPNWMSGGK